VRSPANITPEEWAGAEVPEGFRTRRTFINRGCGVFDSGVMGPPAGFVHIERDDALDWFECDEQAAANVSASWRWYCPISERVSPKGCRHPAAEPGMFEPYSGPPTDGVMGCAEDYWTHNPEMAAWFNMRDALFGGAPECGVRAIVPVADAIAAGLLGDEACPNCGDEDGSRTCGVCRD